MTVSEALHRVTRLCLDTSALVDLVQVHPRAALAWSRLLPRVESGEITLVASPLLIAEALVTAYVTERGREEYDLAFARLEQAPFTEETARLAADVGIYYHLETTDALHMATALLSGCEAILTSDSDFARVRGYPLPGAPERVLKVILTQELTP